MSDIKNLIKAKSHDPYREFEIVSYLTCFETAHKEFFKFMAEKGYELYKKKDYLRKSEQKDAMPSGWLMNVRFISLF